MKKLIIYSFLLPAFIIEAQMFDETFLESLPDDIRADVMARSENQNEEETFRASDVTSSVPQAEELINLKNRLESDLRELEKRLQSGETLELDSGLQLFGSDFFSTFQTSFMPINEPNPDSSYTLGVGDILDIILTEPIKKSSEYQIRGDGAINLPDVGKVVIVGLTLTEASQLIKSRVKSTYIGAEAFISLSQLRDVNVLITGNSENPGIYTLSGNTNILHAISVAGGISEFGSYREINLVRDDKVIESLDIYDLLIDGKYNLKERLRSGDVIFVQPRKSIVTIDGAIKRPAKYELKDDQNLGDVIDYANGFKQTADIMNIYLERILDGTLKSIPITNSIQFDSIKQIDGDLIYIREHPFRTATITGAVLKPGNYKMAAGENLDDLIIKAGGFTENAYPFGAVFQNKDAKVINEKAQELLYQEFLDNIIALSQQNISGLDITPIVGLTQEINNTEANGRIVVDMENEDARKTLGIQEGDNLIVPEKTNNVYVYGEVSSEGSVMYAPGEGVDFFIDKSGGYKQFADNDSIYILHPNGETDRYSKRRNVFESQPRSSITIYPGSVIFVPRKIDSRAARTLAAQAYVTILGNLGLALASLNSISTDWFQWKRMFSKLKIVINRNSFLLIAIFSLEISADSFDYNLYNNHGIVGLINTPTARSYDAGVHGVTIYGSDIDQKITVTSNPYDWFEASVFYMNTELEPTCRGIGDQVFCQGYKDKGFNVKFRLKEEGTLPAIAIGLTDFAGTGIYSSEYIVSSYGIGNLDMHFGLGWGQLSGTDKTIKNPLGYLKESFYDRQGGYSGEGGQLNLGKYFSGEQAAPFFGVSYKYKDKFLLQLEKDTTQMFDASLLYPERESDFSFGFKYSITDNFTIGLSHERGSYSSFTFVYKNNPSRSFKKYEYRQAEVAEDDNKYEQLINNLQENDIGVRKVTETSRSIGLDLTQFVHSDIRLIEDIVSQAARDAGITKDIKTDLNVAGLKAVTELDEEFQKSADVIYERDLNKRVFTNTGIIVRPFLAGREEFFKGAILLENNTEFIIRENFFFNTNLKYSLANNFEDLAFPPVDTFPAQVRSDVKQYLKNINDGVLIGRMQFDYHLTPKPNHHLMLTAGILEDFFQGAGVEYLYFIPTKNYAFGVEAFKVKKRDYDWWFGTLDYENITATANFYYRNYGTIPFDVKLSFGEYLAGDVGTTFEISRTFDTGVKFGAFATFTDVSSEDFGEGSFDKGIFFSIPIYGNLINYTWRPLTKDPGAKLIRKHTLYDLLVKFKPIK